MFDPRPSQWMMKFRLFEDTTQGSNGKVVQVYRKKCAIYTELVEREKTNGTTVHVGIHPSKVVTTRLKLAPYLQGHYVMRKWSIHQEDIAMPNVSTPNKGAAKMYKTERKKTISHLLLKT